MKKKLVFRIRKRYYDMIVAGEKTVEYRRDSSFWRGRLRELINGSALPHNYTAIFICGKRIHRREIIGIRYLDTPENFSDQGKKDVNTPKCFAFRLGEEIQV